MKKENNPFWCTRFGLKLEVMLPFLLAYAGGSSGAFDEGFLAAILLAVLNTWCERWLSSAQERKKRFFVSLTFGLVVIVICSGLLVGWKIRGTLVSPIAYYGSGRTSLVIGSMIVGWRLAFLMVDESSARR